MCQGDWDDNRIAQVLSNLLGNAVQYGDAAETIVLRLHPSADEVLLCVENRGKVIPPETINTVLEPLVRLAGDDAQLEPAGNSLGIGLHIAREIVRAHGGTISVTSTQEHGTVFAIKLPRHVGANDGQQWVKPAA